MLFILLVCSAAFAQTEKPPAKYSIAYNVLLDSKTSNYEIFVMDTDGKNQRNISNSPGTDWLYSAHGDKLYFVSSRDCQRCYSLYEMDADGKNVRKLLEQKVDDSFVSARNKGRELIIEPRIADSKTQQFWIIDAASGKTVREIKVDLALINDPAFSPNGKQVVFRGAKVRPSAASAGGTEFDELYIMNDDGSGLRKLTSYPADDKTAKWHDYHAGPPRWVSKTGLITYPSQQKSKMSLYGITPDGKRQFKLTEGTNDEGYHDWTPDGRWMTMDTALPIEGTADKKNYDIYLYDRKNKKQIRLTTGERYEQCPVFVKKK
jgi:TolB protein